MLALGLPIVLKVSLGTISPPVSQGLIDKLGREFASKLLMQQNLEPLDAGAGGFRFSTTERSGPAQPWTTAQILVALEEWDKKQKQPAEAFRGGIKYLIATRLATGGWGYLEESTPPVTEVNGWILIALIRSLGPDLSPRLWSADEEKEIVDVVREELDNLARYQLDDGSWPSLAPCNSLRNARNYSAVMALWALTEARANPQFASRFSQSWRQAANAGVQNILQQFNREPASPWISTRPELAGKTGRYAGLSAQALLVMHRAAHAFPELGLEAGVNRSIEAHIGQAVALDSENQWLSARALDDNDRAHDSDRYLANCGDRTGEGSSYLWYPWTIALAGAAADDRSASEKLRRDSTFIVQTMGRRADQLPAFVNSDGYAYPVAETLFALAQFKAEPAKGDNKR